MLPVTLKKFVKRGLQHGRAGVNVLRLHGRQKIFCIGQNKTGTTSLMRAFRDLGYVVGDQRRAELIYDRYYFEGNFKPLIRYCRTAQVFQDVPFSCPDTWRHLDRAFPGSRFILSVRDDAHQWYESLTRFHSRLFGQDGRLPTVEDLRRASYVRPGFMANIIKMRGTPEHDPYNRDILIAHYERHNRDVIAYFSERPDDLLVINLASPGAYRKFTRFLGINSPYRDFPWENRG